MHIHTVDLKLFLFLLSFSSYNLILSSSSYNFDIEFTRLEHGTFMLRYKCYDIRCITCKLIHVQQTSVLKSSSDLMDDMVILTLSPNNIEGKSEGLKRLY